MKKLLSMALASVLLVTFSSSMVLADGEGEVKVNSKQNKVIKKWEENSEKESVKLKIHWDKKEQTPRFITGKLTDNPVKGEKDVISFLNDNMEIFKLESGEFDVKKVEDDELGMTHYKTILKMDKIPVYGSELVVHTDKNNVIYSVNGQVKNNVPNKSWMDYVEITGDEALEIAEDTLDFTPNNETYTRNPSPKLYLYEVEDEWRVAYLVTLTFIRPYPGDWRIFVDAEKGDILDKFNEATLGQSLSGSGIGTLGDTKDLNVYYENNRYYLYDTTKPMNGAIITYDGNYGTALPGNYVTDNDSYFDLSRQSAAVDAHYYAGLVYDYYNENFGRNSYDGNGSSIKSTVHYKSNWNNAAWVGTQMVYGDGDGSTFSPLSGALDIVAHELTHAVTQETADLEYRNQSGALNESMSDVFAVLVENDTNDWLVGEDCYTPGTPGDALRSMKNPTLYNQPDHMDNYRDLPNTEQGDWGGVHINSGIPNKAFYYIASDIGFEKSGDIYYRALTTYLTSKSNFEDCRNALVQSASDIYGSNSQEVSVIEDSFAAVGIGDTSGGNPGNDDTYEPNDSASSAYGPLESGMTYESYISSATDNDIYYFNTNSYTDINISLTNLPGDYDLYLYDSQGNQVDKSENGNTSNESITYSPNSTGKYYIQVVGYNGANSDSVAYKLTVNYGGNSLKNNTSDKEVEVMDTNINENKEDSNKGDIELTPIEPPVK
ncbi:M4 family metallopeptidase [Dethiothermospora halolimnae]|uniref:M4 family metallopeptidase n=1 Tax=Dethiothermospora halolimnae TaxID=3114390 RepID=UPI003CCBC826